MHPLVEQLLRLQQTAAPSAPLPVVEVPIVAPVVEPVVEPPPAVETPTNGGVVYTNGTAAHVEPPAASTPVYVDDEPPAFGDEPPPRPASVSVPLRMPPHPPPVAPTPAPTFSPPPAATRPPAAAPAPPPVAPVASPLPGLPGLPGLGLPPAPDAVEGGFVLSEDQRVAIEILVHEVCEVMRTGTSKVGILVGPAGTGKSTIIDELVNRLSDPELYMFPADSARRDAAEQAVRVAQAALDGASATADLAKIRARFPGESVAIEAKYGDDAKTLKRFNDLFEMSVRGGSPNERQIARTKMLEILDAENIPEDTHGARRFSSGLRRADASERDQRYTSQNELRLLQAALANAKNALARVQQEADAPPRVPSFVFLAPTGKAAARLRETSGEDASTIHRALYGSMREDRQESSLERRFRERRECLEVGEADPYPEDGDLAEVADEIARRAQAAQSLEKEKPPEKIQLVFGDPHAPCETHTVLIIDEAGMVNAEIHEHLIANLPTHVYLLYVGDKAQLKPVEGGWGPDLDHPTAELTTVHRQALNSPVLRIATAVRQGTMYDKAWRKTDPPTATFMRRPYGTTESTLPNAIQWLVGRRRAGADATLIVHRNVTRQAVNDSVRAALGLTHPVEPGDLLAVMANNHPLGLMNGEILSVEKLYNLTELRRGGSGKRRKSEEDEPNYLPNGGCRATFATGGTAFIAYHLIGRTQTEFRDWLKRTAFMRYAEWMQQCEKGYLDPDKIETQMMLRDNWLHVDYGQAITAHKAQGSQWDEVGVAWESSCWGMLKSNPSDAYRWLYTAITRAKHRLSVWYT